MAASTSPPTAAAKPKPKSGATGGGKKYGPLTRTQWIIAGVVIAATIGYIFYKRYEAAKAASAASSSTTSSGDCTDDNGNSVPCGSGDGDLSSLEDELDSLLSGEAAGGGASTGTVGTTTGTTGTGTATGTTGTSTGTTASTGSGTSTATADWSYPAPAGLKATSVSKTGYSLSWSPVTGPNGQKPANYTVATYNDQGTEVDQFISGSTSTKEYGRGGTGLHPGYQYHSNVWANGGPKAPAHASVSVTLKS